jgi:hypothetical protein
LRVGLHLIRHLAPGRYWVMDVSEFLLEEGRKILGEGLFLAKRPNLRVISAGSVAEAAAEKPAILLPSKVLNCNSISKTS